MKVGIDVGGTFTDLYAYDQNGMGSIVAKVLSTPEDFTIGVLSALADAGIHIRDIDFLIHGSTIVTNACIEKTYPEAPFITTRGFRDFTHIGRYHRQSLYNPYQRDPEPFVKRRHIFEISERVDKSGHIIEPLDTEEADSLAGTINDLGFKSVAVGFLNSYANAVHEEKMRSILRSACPDVFVAISATIPNIRALGRFTSAVLRACLQPVAKKYLDKLTESLSQEGFQGRLLIVTNNGGMVEGKIATERPELMLTSGPASGVSSSLFLGRQMGKENLITIDMGGTSCDVSIIQGGKPLITSEYEIQWDNPVNVPMLDIRTIGAGGGSLAVMDEGGSIKVGPKSAGSLPGPACYGKGGSEATVTDANLALGRLSARQMLGKDISLDLDAAQMAIKKIGDQLDLDLLETASGIITIVNESMAASLRQVSLDRGRDPRDYSLVAFGGAGAMHGTFLAGILGINQVIIPRESGVFSAFGAVVMDFKIDHEKTFYCPIDTVDLSLLNRHFRELDEKSAGLMRAQKISPESIEIIRSAQMRYIGQTYEVETPVPAGEISDSELREILNNFHNEHKKEYGFSEPAFPGAFVNLRSSAIGKTENPEFGLPESDSKSINEALVEKRNVYFEESGFTMTDVFDRAYLAIGTRISGPAIVNDRSSTTIIPPNTMAGIDGHGNIIIDLNP